jgi:hypothetical protein
VGALSIVFIFSSPRSGSTWLGKLLDTDSDVLYLHEPDKIDRGLDLLPYWVSDPETPARQSGARRYLLRLLTQRSHHVTGQPPFFPKSYRAQEAEQLRRVLIYTTKLASRLGLGTLADRVCVPDLSDNSRRMIPVIKSVGAHGRAAALLGAAGRQLRPILLLRHPCACIASQRRGRRLGLIGHPPEFGGALETATARRLRISTSPIPDADEIERAAWLWLVPNAEAYRVVTAAGGLVLRLDEIMRDPQRQIERILDYCGLAPQPQLARFLAASHSRSGAFFSVFRRPEEILHGWQDELSRAETRRIEDIVARDPIGQSFSYA